MTLMKSISFAVVFSILQFIGVISIYKGLYASELWAYQQKIVAKKDDSRMIEAFSKLELFIPIFPGDLNTDRINGFVEFRETFVRSVRFFWPRDELRVTTVLDDVAYANDLGRDYLISRVKSLFADDLTNKVSVKFNPSNDPFYVGWEKQQLIQFWADNFTDAEYIGFVDDDTIITSAVNPYDLFDEDGMPRVIVNAAHDNNPVRSYVIPPEILFKKPPQFYSMIFFPFVMKREHIVKMRELILANFPEFSCFDDVFHHIIALGRAQGFGMSQFCVMAEYMYNHHREEYSWHLEMSPEHKIEFSTPGMFEPFPRIAIHGNYAIEGNTPGSNSFKTLRGRRIGMAALMREGYCHSLLSWNNTEHNATRCMVQELDDIYERGEWKFETQVSKWMAHWDVSVAHNKRRQHHLTEHIWDEDELIQIFELGC
uniref:Uncharacterized protein n=1 Tax=Pseudo-nitzschia australis TaxID=44445 RepID=A0A7S4ALP7_9STRA|mmetsp:Transcript_5215/g.11543  ORF Transcript_5215/g.11543 Transcript_5215/m.11543 type:complete len:427 (-) Transcript_5215:273-1553(-)